MAGGPERQAETLLRTAFQTAVRSTLPEHCLPAHLPRPPSGRLAIIAAGKAAVGMARAANDRYGRAGRGLIVAPAGTPNPDIAGFEFIAAGHPVPDTGSVAAASRALELAASLAPDDLLLTLISGGASALLAAPVDGVTLDEKRELTRALLASGAPIGAMNLIRKCLSRIKGGRLADASAAPVVTLAISDVAGDDPAAIGSGPTVEDAGRLADARRILARHAIQVPAGIHAALNDPANEPPDLSGRANDLPFTIVASGNTALEAAARLLTEAGFVVGNLGDDVEGDTRAVACEHAERIRGLARDAVRDRQPRCLLSGGELTVKLGPSPGAGGPNTDYLLALALELSNSNGMPASCWGLAADTDGIDGHGGHAGALFGPDTIHAAAARGLDPADFLAHHDSARFFAESGGLLTPGPSGTNVNDFRCVLVLPD
ncbi:glycerate kinase type-2 family protein [Elongatibacter sediminis]|uniref:DUF4147 domain-containing protein n=1 Tax=Elongatibacter sediminis TaxID=3119006 RepID=A0AAW9RIG8_9GAMM